MDRVGSSRFRDMAIKENEGRTVTPDSTTAASNEDKRSSLTIITDGVSSEDGSIGSLPGNAVRVPKKFITTWRHACDKTKDRTRDLFKRWRTLPEMDARENIGTTHDNEDDVDHESGVDRRPNSNSVSVGTPAAPSSNGGWSVHVWTTWVKRYPSDDEDNMFDHNGTVSTTVVDNVKYLTSVQKEKLEHLFSHLLDTDRDDLISIQDFDTFCEKLKHFADWSENSPEFITLQQVKDGFVEHFIMTDEQVNFRTYGSSRSSSVVKRGNANRDAVDLKPLFEVISLEEWLGCWGKLLHNAQNFNDFPVWLQYLPKILYQAINTSGSGVISRDELSAFYSAILGMTTRSVNELLENAYKAMTSNGEHPLTYSVYRLCFANFLLGRYPNGPGQFIFGHMGKHVDTFPIDYSAMNTPPDELEQYTPDRKSNRRSVIV